MSQASTKLIHRFESKLDADGPLDAHLEAMDRKLRVLQWIVGIGVSLCVALWTAAAILAV